MRLGCLWGSGKDGWGTSQHDLRPRQRTTSEGAEPAGAAAKFEDAMRVRQVQGGELQAFTELVRKYQDRVYNACLRICGDAEEARDLTQEAFLKAFESIEKFRGKSAFFTWIFRIAVNLSISHQRRVRSRATLSLDEVGGSTAGEEAGSRAGRVEDVSTPDPSSGAVAAETHVRVADALAELDAEQRAVIVLRDMEGFDYQAIADVLELPVGTVKSRIFRARLALRERLKAWMAEESA